VYSNNLLQSEKLRGQEIMDIESFFKEIIFYTKRVRA